MPCLRHRRNQGRIRIGLERVVCVIDVDVGPQARRDARKLARSQSCPRTGIQGLFGCRIQSKQERFPRGIPMHPADLRRYKKLLEEKQLELVAKTELEACVPRAGESQGDLIDQANAEAEADIQIRLHRDSRLVRAIDEALARMRKGTYGICETCNQPISGVRGPLGAPLPRLQRTRTSRRLSFGSKDEPLRKHVKDASRGAAIFPLNITNE